MDGIQINGNKKFVFQTKKALRVLKSKSSATYTRVVLKYVKKIKSHKISGMNVFARVPTYEVGIPTAFESLKWYASTIAHDAYHSKLYFDYKKKHKRSVPRRVYAGVRAELICIKFQIKVGRKIGLAGSKIKYLKTLDGSHAKFRKITW